MCTARGNTHIATVLLGALSSCQSKVFGSLPREQLGSCPLPEAQGQALPPMGVESEVGSLFPPTTARCLHPAVRKWKAAFLFFFFIVMRNIFVSTPCHRELRDKVHADSIVVLCLMISWLISTDHQGSAWVSMEQGLPGETSLHEVQLTIYFR